ncbi:hypothetical protein AYI70_g6917, partial [Smittium culicis]
MLSLLV